MFAGSSSATDMDDIFEKVSPHVVCACELCARVSSVRAYRVCACYVCVCVCVCVCACVCVFYYFIICCFYFLYFYFFIYLLLAQVVCARVDCVCASCV